jgi:ATP-dependent 26S proteasome regulatory subunit
MTTLQAASPGPIASSDDVSDAKLLHLVRKLIDLSSDTATPNSDYIVTILRTQHREYLRKDIQRLKAQVEAAVRQILGQQETTAESRKRKALEDEEYDLAAAENDAAREKLNVGGGLNASLRARYQQVQQTRDETAAVTASESAFEGNTQGEEAGDNEPNEASDKKNKGAQKGDKTAGGVKRRSVKSRKSPGSNMLGSSTGGDVGFLTPVMRPTERYSDLGGMAGVVQQIRQLVEYPLIRPELYRHLGVDPPRGVLLRGPPGTGKTHLAKAGKWHLIVKV